MTTKYQPMTQERLRKFARDWRDMHRHGTRKQVAEAEAQASSNERLADAMAAGSSYAGAIRILNASFREDHPDE